MRRLKIKSLPKKEKQPEWVERNVLMLHACFQILSNFVEKDGYNLYNETHKEFCDEVDELYAWWQTRKLSVYAAPSVEDEDQIMLKRLIEIRESIF